MEIRAAERELSVRLYRWSLGEAIKEAKTSYPNVRRISNSGVRTFLHIVDHLALEERLSFTTACVKVIHQKAVLYVGDSLSEQERADWQKYWDLITYHGAKGTGHRVEKQQAARQFVPWKRPHIVACVREQIKQSISKDDIGRRLQLSSVELDYERTVGNWRFGTSVLTGPRGCACDHQLVRVDDDLNKSAARAARPDINFHYLNLMGIPGGVHWEILDADDLREAAEALTTICAYVCREIPPLLDGLSGKY